MLKCKMFNFYSSGSENHEEKVNAWLKQQPADMTIVSITQSSCPGSALGLGEGVRTILTILYR